MALRIFGVLAEDDSKQRLKDSIESKYAASYEVTPNFFLFVADPEDVVNELEFGEPLPDQDDKSISGVVFSLNGTIGGYYSKKLWDWIKIHRG